MARTNGIRFFSTLLSAFSVVLWSSGALAQDSAGFSVNRFDPSERGSDWFWAESLDLRGHNRWAVGVVGDWGYKPLMVYDNDGDEVRSVLRHQVVAHLGASVIFWDRLRLGVSFPLAVYQKGKEATLDGTTYPKPESGKPGDLRIGADVRLFGEYGDFVTIALGGHVHAPTGSQGDYMGDGAARIVPRVSVAGDVGIFTYSVKTGIMIRFAGDDFAGQAMGSEWTFGAAAGLRLLDRKLTIGPEVWASTVISDGGEGFFKEGSTPFEGVLGAHYRFHPNWQIGAGFGPGFTQAVGSPELRTLLSLEWVPRPKEPPVPQPVAPPADSDGDGIVDTADACPSVAGTPNDDATKHGCPPPEDSDGDGIVDPDDACPEVAGVESEDPSKNGCQPDRDGDGILDQDDACVSEAGPENEDPEKHGCPPPPDSDGDGILDEVDACAQTPGVESEDPQKHGCPRAKIEGGQVKILDRIEFDTGKSSIRGESLPVLQAVLDILVKHPEILRVRIEGHTDNRGSVFYNKRLSEMRAGAVVEWLVERGVERRRLTPHGVGPDLPIDTNDTDSGRQNNRRVEFHIVETKATSDTAQETR